MGPGSQVGSTMNKNVKTSVEIEPKWENDAKKKNRLTEKPRKEKD
jgi:hypothetical protein